MDEQGRRDEARPDSESSEPFLIAIGASAGGLEAIEEFFDHVRDTSQSAYVVVQHLSPDFKSLMDELLAKHTKLSIHKVTHGMRVEPGSIYLIPPRKNLILSEGALLLEDQEQGKAPAQPIDIFLLSLARQSRQHAAAVILSGTGSDGTRGVQAVKEAGGLVLVQDPASAKFDGMPKAAIASGVVDFVLPPNEMPGRIEAYFSHSIRFLQEMDEENALSSEDDPMARILVLLLRAHGLDFRQYKPRTIHRRIHRRMMLRKVESLEEYFDLVHENAAELERLYHELLIGVTEFFRDSEAYDVLAQTLIPQLVASAQGGQLRVWVTACSTGEEAYSLGILLHEYLEEHRVDLSFKIFATDVDPHAVGRASEGTYSQQQLQGSVSEERLRKYFERTGEHYRVARSIRERVVFAAHNLVKDPPFTRMDLVTCRNLLIYLEPATQAQVVQYLHFALRPKGYLFLGSSETLADLAAEFYCLHSRWKIFQKKRDVRLSVLPQLPLPRTSALPLAVGSGLDAKSGFSRACASLVADFAPAALLVGSDFELLHTFGDASPYLRLPEGRMSQDVLRMFGTEARVSVSTALHRAAKTGGEVTYTEVRLGFDDDSSVADIHVRALSGDGPDDAPLFLILIGPKREPTFESAGEVFDANEQATDRIDSLEKELLYTRENLQATIQELETANEELQSTNEELLASNEELQSTNEELHSVNEELFTVNSEHQNKIDELIELSDDIENLFRATEIGTIFLDEDLRIRKFTPAVADVVALIDNDVGRPIAHLRTQLRGLEITDLAVQVLETGERVEREVSVENGQAVLLRALPYKSPTNARAGVILTFVELDEVREAQEVLAENEEQLRQLVDHVDKVLWVASADGREVHFVSQCFERLWGHPVSDLYEDFECWFRPVHVEDRDRMRTAYLAAPDELDIEVRIETPAGELRWVHVKTHRIPKADGSIDRIAGFARDVTEQKEQELKLVRLSRELEDQAYRDALTGLMNRRGAQRELVRETKRATRTGAKMSAIIVDLDEFKSINDNLGHAAGDLVLQSVAARMKHSLRPQDLPSRVGGDEFVVILPETREAEARVVAERLRLAISEQPLTTHGEPIRVTGSLGVATIPPDVVSIEEVLVSTRDALKASKQAGKNRVSQVSGNGVEEVEEQYLDRIVRDDCLRALAQEIRRLDDSSVAGYELLSRGPHGPYETPNALFRLSLENNVLGMVDLKCLRKCVETSALLNGHGRIHLNLFPTTIIDTPPERLVALLEKSGGGQRFCIEISEQQFLGEPSYLRANVTALREAGVQIAIDDVGFGRSSLESLILLEPDVVKIDRAFVHGISTDKGRRRSLERLVRSTMLLTDNIIAEGVELMDERDLLAEMGVQYAQGFLWGRPSAVVVRA